MRCKGRRRSRDDDDTVFGSRATSCAGSVWEAISCCCSFMSVDRCTASLCVSLPVCVVPDAGAAGRRSEQQSAGQLRLSRSAASRCDLRLSSRIPSLAHEIALLLCRAPSCTSGPLWSVGKQPRSRCAARLSTRFLTHQTPTLVWDFCRTYVARKHGGGCSRASSIPSP